MNAVQLTNSGVWSKDWAGDQRRAALRKMARTMPRSKPGRATAGVWMSDVSAADSRSVKAWLVGRGDHRVLFWKVKRFFGLVPELYQDHSAEGTEVHVVATRTCEPSRRFVLMGRSSLAHAS